MKQTINETPKKFEIGKVYEVRDTEYCSGHNYNSILYKVVKRTAQFVTFENEKGETKRVKVQLKDRNTLEWVNYNSTSGLAGLTANRVYETESADSAVEDHAEDTVETETATSEATVAPEVQEVSAQAEIENAAAASKPATEIKVIFNKSGKPAFWTKDAFYNNVRVKRDDMIAMVEAGEAKLVRLYSIERNNFLPAGQFNDIIVVLDYKTLGYGDRKGGLHQEVWSKDNVNNAIATAKKAKGYYEYGFFQGALIENADGKVLVIINKNGEVVADNRDEVNGDSLLNEVSVDDYAATVEAQEVAMLAEIDNANSASEETNKAPFSDEEATLLDRIEKAAADNILLRHGNHEAAHQATLDREAAEADLGKLAMQARRNGDDEHFKLLFNEMQARIKRGTEFGEENENAAGQYVRGEATYQPLGNRSIVVGINNVNDKTDDMDKSSTEIMLEELAKGFDVIIKTYGANEKVDTVKVATFKEALDIVEKSTDTETAYEIFDRHNEQTIYFRNTIGTEHFYINKQEVERDEFAQIYDMGADETFNKPFDACFCTFNGDEDDITSSFETKSAEFATVQEAYEACRTFIKTCDGYLFAGCYIEHWNNSGCKTIFNCTCENFETFYIDGKEVEFDAFNAKYHVYAPKFTAELDELFRDYEDKSYEVYQAEYFQNHKAIDAGIAARSKVGDAIWEAIKNYSERKSRSTELSKEFTDCTERAQARFDNWKADYEMIQDMKAEGKSVSEMVAALNGTEVVNNKVNAEEGKLIANANTGEMNRHEQIREQFKQMGAKVFDINDTIRKAAKFGRKTLLESYEKWHDYAERVNYLLPIIEVKNKNGNLLYYRDSIFNGLESIPKPVVAKLVVEGLAFIKRVDDSILVNLLTERNAPAEWLQKEATADERAAEEDAKDKADYENRIGVINSNIEKTFAKNDFTPEQVQAFKAIYDYEFAATVKGHIGSKATNYDELKAQHDAAYKKLRADSHAAKETNNFDLFLAIHGAITDHATLGQLEAVYSIYWGDLQAMTPNEAEVNGSPMFYMNDTDGKAETDRHSPFTTVIELAGGDEREQFSNADEAMNHVQKRAAENPTAECKIEDADGDMIYEDDKIQIRYYDTKGNEVDYDTFLKIYLALKIDNDCGQSSILTA